MQPAYDQLGSIARQIGTRDFMHQMHRFITRQIRVDHVALEYLDHNQQLIPLDRASISSLPIKQLGKAYRENELFRKDPMRQLATEGKDLGRNLRLMLNFAGDLQQVSQGALFSKYGIVQRLVVGGQAGRGWISLKMIRCEHFGLASDQELSRLENIAGVLIDLSVPHAKLLLAQRDPQAWFHQVRHSERIIDLIFPALSSRECQCVSLVLQGKSNVQAAHELGISTNTFITLRSRAYKKTGASCSNDLEEMVQRHISIS